ncbi:plp-dependent transferase [Diaporthe amygdali]|uniref:plp-dependent transferase n=1 Tax=Phomopsis amygdali TaxID=1214568 RepID=UPI0022FE4DA6|nr:plp-dependent transferase [Diaporthe amygdali]KAJ0118581.1 plp-dependent transferase [Diaporthe amygdali]
MTRTSSTRSLQPAVGGDADKPDTQRELPLDFGKGLRDSEFLFDKDYHNLNHGSFGTIPVHIQKRLQHYQALHERRPDQFIRYDFPAMLDENREAAARLINAPSVDEVVFVANATVGLNTVLRSLPWSEDGKDEIIHFSTIYGAIGKTVDYVVDSAYGRVSSRSIELTYPISDDAIMAKFRQAVHQSRQLKRPRAAVFDVVSSVPGVCFPYEEMIRACRELGILSIVDGAQGIGMMNLDMTALDPDFFVSNCHKWLLAPRGCAVFYVPFRNQHLIRSTVPTSHGYIPLPGATSRANPLPPSAKSAFVNAFEYVGTLDNSPYLCVKDSIEFRERVLGGEGRIQQYMRSLAKHGGEKISQMLGTWVMGYEHGKTERFTNCAMVNIAMPLVVLQDTISDTSASVVDEQVKTETWQVSARGAAPVCAAELHCHGSQVQARVRDILLPHEDAERIWNWMTKALVDDYQTFIPLFYHNRRFWARLSAQVYLDMDDFLWAGKTLKVLCERVARREYGS